MKLIKLSSDHYIIVDDSEIKEGDYYWNELDKAVRVNNTINHPYHKKITHSTQPIEHICCTPEGQIKRYVDCKGCDRSSLGYNKIQQLFLSEVKELLGEVDVEKMAVEWYNGQAKYDSSFIADPYSWKEGYNQALEDNKHMRFTHDELLTLAIRCWNTASNPMERSVNNLNKIVDEYIQRFELTQWDVEFVDGKLKLI